MCKIGCQQRAQVREANPLRSFHSADERGWWFGMAVEMERNKWIVSIS